MSWKPSLGFRALGMARPQFLKLAPKQVTRIEALQSCPELPAIVQKNHRVRVWVPELMTVGRLEVAGSMFLSSPYFPILVINLALFELGTLSHPSFRGMS